MTCRIDFQTFSIVANHNNRGIEIMALSERPEVDEDSIPKPPTGYRADVRWQKVIDLTADMGTQMLSELILELQSLNAANPGS
jgi:hypothetical protein